MRNQNTQWRLTWGLIRTKSIKSTTKSCSTYLSQKRPQLRHTVSRILCPLALSPAPEYAVQSVLTGCLHSMQIGILPRYQIAYKKCELISDLTVCRLANTISWPVMNSESWCLKYHEPRNWQVLGNDVEIKALGQMPPPWLDIHEIENHWILSTNQVGSHWLLESLINNWHSISELCNVIAMIDHEFEINLSISRYIWYVQSQNPL